MAATKFLIVLVTGIIQHLHLVREELDEATWERMQQHAEQLSQEMARMLQEVEQSMQEQGTQEQDGLARVALLFGALLPWHLWAITGVLLLVFMLCCWIRKRSREVDHSGKVESSSCNTEQEEVESNGEDLDDENDIPRIFAKPTQWSVPNLAYRNWVVEVLVGDLLRVFQEHFSNRFFPVLQPAIGVGRAFEGWSFGEDDTVYSLLVPLQPPRGHVFHLELGTMREMPLKDSCIRVELQCTCAGQQLVENMLCFLHHPEEELRKNQDPSLLRTLCTDSYLDAWKTARWFQKFVSSAWVMMPQSHHYTMQVLPSSRSCILQLTNASGRTLLVELMFGVQHGNSDIFLSSGSAESLFTSSTTWPESYAVAEAKFFRHVARQAPHDSFHLNCLQLCTSVLGGTDFSTSTLKTVVMHLLKILPWSDWHRSHLLSRLRDIMRYLHLCLRRKQLDHFFLGNEMLPEEIVLPPSSQSAKPLNLFQHLQQDPDAHAKALQEFNELQDRLSRLLFYAY
ncbi:inositol 1,4,5-trisphosphate receptor-interacting protein-like 1 [Chlamydotis macqueenii]